MPSRVRIVVSETYFPGAGAQMICHNLEKDPRNHADLQLGYEDKDGEGQVKPGLSNGWTKNAQYRALIAECGVMNFSDVEIIDALACSINCQVASNSKCLFRPFKYAYAISCADEILKRNIMTAWTNGWSI